MHLDFRIYTVSPSSWQQGIINHSRLISEFSQALAKISDALRQTKLTAELFQTDPVKDAISQLYAHIILFFQQAVRWYNRSSAGRAFSSIFKPYELEYEDTIEQIKLCAEAISDMASAASRAEVRDMHITIQLMRREMQRRDQKLTEMQLQVRNTQRKQSQMHEIISDSLQVANSGFFSYIQTCYMLTRRQKVTKPSPNVYMLTSKT
jgi:hypothetical protein